MLPRKNKGFFLLELLLSLAAWFMLCLFILPMLIELNKQAIQLEVTKKAEQLLYEELQAKLIDGQSYISYSVYYHNIEYKIIWRNQAVIGLKEVCVKVEKNAYFQETEICMVPEWRGFYGHRSAACFIHFYDNCFLYDTHLSSYA
jgi:competence protein ComGE